ncbi:hypothetical protein BJF84_21510 [Rhodococcus sp. CUA-806]|jgi:2-keto-4-pentenoate hydratase/2-oxohepta-3-ene-1,7-dioic acid hydratase in catechol pathway|nr:hypothetical protein BJF84_21510 [Rhodococcus sp. CUA-806]
MRLAMLEVHGSARTVLQDRDGTLRDATEVTGPIVADVDITAFEKLTEESIQRLPAVAVDEETRWLTPVIDPHRILCVGFNYRKHAQEVDAAEPKYPTFFVRFPSSLTGHGQPIETTAASDTLDWEGEIAVVIGRGGRNITAADAMDHVWGYTALGDNSIREFQGHGTQSTAGKNFDRTGSFGPFLVTLDEIPDPGALEMLTYVNGEQVQHGRASDLIFDVPALIEYISSWTTLSPGDVIATGTPSGIGFRQDPPRFLHPGETLTIDIPGVTTLTNQVV